MSRVVVCAVLIAIVGFSEGRANAAEPGAGRFDYPLAGSCVDSSAGFFVTGTVWEAEDPPAYKALNYEIKLFDSDGTTLLKETSGQSYSFGGFYDYMPTFNPSNSFGYLQLEVQNTNGTWSLGETIMIYFGKPTSPCPSI